MTEVVYGYFGTKRNSKQDHWDSRVGVPTEAPAIPEMYVIPRVCELLEGYDQDMAMSDIHYISSNVECMGRLRVQVEAIQKVLSPHRYPKALNAAVILKKRQLIRLIAMSEISMNLLPSHGLDWLKKPAYYATLAIEFNARMERIRLLSA